MKGYPYIIQSDTIVLMMNNKCYNITKTHIAYNKLLEAIKTADWETVEEVIEPRKILLNYGSGNIAIQGETLFWKETELHNSLTKRIIRMYQEGFSIEPMVKFMENLMENPSHTAVQELYGFLENNDLPVTPDGCFLAYKKVRDDYTDCHTGTIDNSIGAMPSMDRNMVDDNRDRTCSTGLHFCSLNYLQYFGGSRTMIVKVNPRDVVSFPMDFECSKGRCCEYEVVGELGVHPEEAFTAAIQEK